MRNNLKKTLLYSVFIVFLAGCGGGSGGGDDSASNAALCTTPLRVLGGTTCGQLPSPVVGISITTSRGSTALCSGSVLSSRTVLTAAHCFLGTTATSIAVFNSQETISGTSVTLHPAAAVTITGEVRNDLAIIQLAQPFSDIVPLSLASSSAYVSQELLVYGYGIDGNGNSGVLRAGQLNVSGIDSSYATALSRDGINPCNGDSGGPALIQVGNDFMIAGVLSAGTATSCGDNDLNYYTRVDTASARSFIRAHL